MVSKLNIYFVHSEKCNYNEELYLPVLRSNVLSKHNLIFAKSEANKNEYYKDIMAKADLYVIFLDNVTMAFNTELKNAILSRKPMLTLAKSGVPYDPKYQKLLKNIIGFKNEEELRTFIEAFVKSYENKINGGIVDPTVVLGSLD